MEKTHEKNCETSIKTAFDMLEHMRCWELVSRSKNERVMHTKLCLRKNRDEKEAISKHQASIVIFEMEEVDC